MSDFDGAKIAILRGCDVLSIKRDDDPSIPYPDLWDLPGGGREGAETPFSTVAREVREELGLGIDPARVIYSAEEDGFLPNQGRVHFLLARWDDLDDAEIVFGDEGQGCRWIDARAYTRDPQSVPPLRARLTRALDARGL